MTHPLMRTIVGFCFCSTPGSPGVSYLLALLTFPKSRKSQMYPLRFSLVGPEASEVTTTASGLTFPTFLAKFAACISTSLRSCQNY
jgi:hypothetical protein